MEKSDKPKYMKQFGQTMEKSDKPKYMKQFGQTMKKSSKPEYTGLPTKDVASATIKNFSNKSSLKVFRA